MLLCNSRLPQRNPHNYELCQVCERTAREESGEQCYVVFALIAKEPAPPPPPIHSLAGSATINAKTTVHCYSDSPMLTAHGDLVVPHVEVNVVEIIEKDELPRLMALLHSLHTLNKKIKETEDQYATRHKCYLRVFSVFGVLAFS